MGKTLGLLLKEKEKKMTQKKAIYKIENLINHKIYIGQSSRPEERFREHCWKTESYTSLIHRAIEKYGEQNFSFEILGWFEDYNEKEKYYINFYHSLSPFGYNIAIGGEEPPHPKGENHPNASITESKAKAIKEDLKNWDLPLKTIVKKHKVTNDIVRHIKDGTSWYDINETYPLRPQESELTEIKVNKVIELLKTTNLSQKEIGKIVGWNRSAITMINIGKNHHRNNENYPIRK